MLSECEWLLKNGIDIIAKGPSAAKDVFGPAAREF